MGTNRTVTSPPRSYADMAKQLDCYDTLKHLSNEELRQLVDNEERVHSLVLDSADLIRLSDQKQEIIAENLSMAEYNLARERELQEARERLYRSHLVLGDKQQEYEQTKRQHDAVVGGPSSPDLLLDNLRILAANADSDSERMAQEFVDGEKTIDAFLLEYIPKRTEVHVRTIKVEKFNRYLRGGSANSQQTFY
ncbi:vacuolar protein sorting-associated protein 37B-like [Paramacrobiotus metropolitanus]|uniref:vacuolar protein sorting-associated protein 37B-like n=1 Tax=Paramacrobiotus metropolitanus TaxID=2943436 RepID=UPI002445CF0A|nr:vacuolar protein sorting-associated protein 37B-like [Paramacrobiotus metropolitanus]